MARRLARTPLLLVLASLLLLACNRGLPSGSGEYPIRSLSFDGKEYSFYWTSPDGALHEAHGDDFKLVQDDQRSYLEVGHGTPVLHLKPDEGIAVRGRDSGGSFSSWWFPFMLGYALGGNGPWVTVPQSGPPPTTPSYRYPPTDTFGRGDTLHGSEATSRPSPPDYRKVQPAPNAVSGQNAGTGGGSAATNKNAGASSGQSSGTGAGSAATNKGTGANSGQSGGAGTGGAATGKNDGVSPGGGSAASDKGRGGSGTSAAPAPAAPGGVTSRPGPGSSGGSSRSSGGLRSGGRR
ncbi:MAG TPA: hypothetical protein VFE37_08380 [Chloroflexota bacterium]|nr:hypothetical protein [Chloroflexota bacterium]